MQLFARIERCARDRPDRLAFDGTGRLTYGELREAAWRLATCLTTLCSDDTRPVLVVGHKEPELIVALVAAALAGCAYVPIDSGLPPARVEMIRQHAGATLTLTPDRVRALLKKSPCPARLSGQVTSATTSRALYVMFTSGSTGEPKGVVITHGNLRHFLRWMIDEHAPAPGEVFLNVAPFSFDLSVMDTWVSLASGGTIVALTREQVGSPSRLADRLAASEATIWVSTPSFARLCLTNPSFGQAMLPWLRRFLFCGETLSSGIASALLDRFPNAEVWNTYGPTEATVATTSVRVDRDLLERYSTLPIGHSMPGSRVVVVDEALGERPDGEQGEILIAGPNVSPGYFGRPDLTVRAFCTFEGVRAYRTGDLGRYRDELLFFEGRVDDQVKVNGYRIELGDVEANIRQLSDVRDVAVVTVERDGRIDSLAAFVVGATGDQVSAGRRELELRMALARQLPSYMLPRIVKFMDTLPLTPNGKVDRRALLDQLS